MAWYEAIDKFVGEQIPSWNQVSTANKEKVFEAVLRWLSPRDRDLAKAVADALAQSNHGTPVIFALLSKVAANLTEFRDMDQAALKAIVGRVTAGLLRTEDIAMLAGAYLASLQPSGPTRRLFKVASDGKLNGKNVIGVLLKFVQDELGQTARESIEKRLGDHTDFGPETFVLAFAASVLTFGKLTSINDDDLIEEFVSRIQNLGATSSEKLAVKALVTALTDGDPSAFVIALVKELGFGIEEDVLRSLMKGKGEEVVRKALSDLLQGAGVEADHADALIEFLSEVLKGKVALLPKSEQTELGLSDKAYGFFCRTRIVIFASAQAMKFGPFIPSVPSGSLYGISASQFEATKKLKSCVKTNEFKGFTQLIRDWCRVEFSDELTHGTGVAPAWPVPIGNTTAKLRIKDVFLDVLSEVV